MTCRLCAWICDRLCPPDSSSRAIWRAASEWEDDYATDWEPVEEWDAVRKPWAEARGLSEGNPAAALAIYLELAESGSAYSMLAVGWHYYNGQGTERDSAKAEEYYRRALCAGSWRATICYASRLFERGAHDKWPSTLGDGVKSGFIPSYFWLAWYTYKREPTSRTAREVRHLLETAAEAGHPGARLVLARWTASGKFGLREIPRGFRMLRELVATFIDSERATATADDSAAEPIVLPAACG